MIFFELCWLLSSILPDPVPVWWPAVGFSITWICLTMIQVVHLEFDTSLPMDIWTLLLKAFVLRFSIMVSTLIHELGHLIAAAATDMDSHRTVFTFRNLVGNVDVRTWIIVLIPFLPWPKDAISPHVTMPLKPDPRSHDVIRLSAPIVSVILAAICTGYVSSQPYSTSWIFALGAWVVAIGGISSDLLKINLKETSFYCGNFGMLVICAMDR